ncbi:ankyrin repeat domain-containing protein [Luteimonas sp. RD2P54]|uniref:Ankyrin repeat domain-containing protein n=1 Tax=Luteimonas endophytica TaxID=3042023 RepID=A0ABT6J9Y2_9GAMM|nr:ankyrin repeat domain-containing protein [Luteimonas endophytica]MDH5823637.1 ankyrin repeat domain-containing protein [Luteimonas endophytica]
MTHSRTARPQQPDNLFDAVARCETAAIHRLLAAGADPDEIDLHGYQSTPLAWACSHGDEAAVRALLEAGANPDVAAFDPPLAAAAAHGFAALVGLLIDAGADVDGADESGASALWIAAACGFADIARQLVEAGADRLHADHDGVSPADAARQAGHVALAEYLEDPGGFPPGHGFWRGSRKSARAAAAARRKAVAGKPPKAPTEPAEPEWTFSGGIARSQWATRDFPAVAAAGDTALAAAMLDVGLAPDWTQFRGTPTALMQAARSGELAMVELLLARGAQVDLATDEGATALHFALFKPSARVHAPVVERLLAAGADPDAVDGEGQRPLHRALVHGMAGIVAALIAAGADPFRPDRAGRAPADWAPTTGRHAAAIRKLLDAARAAAPQPQSSHSPGRSTRTTGPPGAAARASRPSASSTSA